jgi:CheY-like chemotaxis protein
MRDDSLESGTEAVAALLSASEKGDPYDFLLLDQHMPAMDGAAVIEAVRSTAAISEVHIILLTSNSYAGSLSNGQSRQGAFADACLIKPVRQSHLLTTLAAVRAVGLDRNAQGSRRDTDENRPDITAEFAGTGLRVLVADDNLVNQTVAVRMLEKFGLRVDVARDGREAVRMLRTEPYSAVFMDCQMPEMDGYEATREIRRSEQPGERIAIIAMTAEALSGARELCLDAGMDDYITKPVMPRDLSRVIETWLTDRPNYAENDASLDAMKLVL